MENVADKTKSQKKKKFQLCFVRTKSISLFKVSGRDGGTWTLTILLPTDFKSVASAYSATSPYKWHKISSWTHTRFLQALSSL